MIFRDESNGYTIYAVTTKDNVYKIAGTFSLYPMFTPIEADIQGNPGKDTYKVLKMKETSKGQEDITRRMLSQVEMSSRDIDVLLASGEDLYTDAYNGRTKKNMSSNGKKLLMNKVLLPSQQREFRELIAKYISNVAEHYNQINSFVEANRRLGEYKLLAHPHLTLVHDIGLPVREADKVMSENGMRLDESERVAAVTIKELSRREKRGDTCATSQEIKETVRNRLLEKDGAFRSTILVENVLKSINGVVLDQGLIQFEEYYKQEQLVFNRLKEMLNNSRPLFSGEELERIIGSIESSEGITYAPQQKSAFKLLKHTGVAILTGGPGTGKTTVIKGLLTAYAEKYPLHEIKLCSPTGRAAQRMSESCGREASTIHRMIGGRRGFTKKEDLAANLVVVDESSMLDTEMASWIFESVRTDALVLLIGDIDQLPSVGPGNILKDLIQSGIVPVCKLQTVYRQAGESVIISNANRINTGKTDLKETEDFKIIRCLTDADVRDQTIMRVDEILKTPKVGKYDWQVLATSRKGDASIVALNALLQEKLNHKVPGMKTVRNGKVEFRLGDKIITTQNNYEDGYFNGDIGEIINITDSDIHLDILGRTVRMQRKNVKDLALGYCISIHKSQGSEFKHVIVVLPDEPGVMLKRNLLYTGVTRAKATCTLVSTKTSIETCITTIDNTIRKTGLHRLLA